MGSLLTNIRALIAKKCMGFEGLFVEEVTKMVNDNGLCFAYQRKKSIVFHSAYFVFYLLYELKVIYLSLSLLLFFFGTCCQEEKKKVLDQTLKYKRSLRIGRVYTFAWEATWSRIMTRSVEKEGTVHPQIGTSATCVKRWRKYPIT